MRNVKDHVVFEISKEVAHKVGGIYSVLKTKAPVTSSIYPPNRYILIGCSPYDVSGQKNLEVEPLETDSQPALHATLNSMKERGINFLYGRWLIEGAPRVLLFELGSGAHWLNEWKSDLWEKAGIPSPPDDSEVNDAVIFGYLVAWFLGEFAFQEKQRAIVAHVHEWLAGIVLPLCKSRNIDCTTIFTTHATLLGRYLCAGSADFYNNLSSFDVDSEAGKRGIYHRYCAERAAAHCCDVFTTVSNITAYECEHLLKRKPDGILPNGINLTKFQAVHEFQNLHLKSKEKINEFVRGHFHGHFDFDLDKTLYFFIAGRHEIRNKGVDMFIESLARLNHKLQMENSDITIVAFLILPASHSSFTSEALEGQAKVRRLHETVRQVQKNIGKRIFEELSRFSEHDNVHDPLNSIEIISKTEKMLLKKCAYNLRRSALPPVVTHNMDHEEKDSILSHIRRCQLFNDHRDRVKIVFHPEFLQSGNPVIPMDYEEFVRGCHLGVFPSYYEPWGYTPAECTVMGVPSITTNLSGFGCYIEDLIEKPADYGIFIIDRRNQSVEDSVNTLTSCLHKFTKKTRRQRVNLRNRCERMSEFLDWKIMSLEYVKARQLALRRKYPECFSEEELGEIEDALRQGHERVTRPLSAPPSPKLSNGINTPGDFGSLLDAVEGTIPDEEYLYQKLKDFTVGNAIDTNEDDDDDDWRPTISLKNKTDSVTNLHSYF